MNNNKHMSLDDRYAIQHGLDEGLSFKAIARTISKDCTTVSKEVRSRLSFIRRGAPYRPFNDCAYRFTCNHDKDICPVCSSTRKTCSICGSCTSICKDYRKEQCSLLLHAPYVCNGCTNLQKCALEKRIYKASSAQKEYEEIRTESRSGFNLTQDELKYLDSVISPLMFKGQSIHHILMNNADLINCCEKTLYLYADNGLFSAKSLDMPRRVRFRPRKKKSVELKVNKLCRIGRTMDDFIQYHKDHPSLPVVELDSVEGKKGRPVLLTIHFVLPKLQLAFLREANTSKSVTDIFDHLYDVLGDSNYRKLFSLCLTDNGTEFSDPDGIEKAPDESIRTRLFYCNPSAPSDKGACENNHEFIRRIIPKGVDIGQYTSDQISLMMDHINSYGRPDLNDKSPYEMFEFYYGKEILDLLGVHKIEPNQVTLKPSLLTKH